MLGFLEKLCREDVGADDIAALRAASLADADIRDATLVCYLFTMYAKMADALGWARLNDGELAASADHLLQRGYGAAGDGERLRRDLERAVLTGEGHTSPALRAAAASGGEVPEDLRALLDKVRRHAYQVTDEEVVAARHEHTQDELFELFLATTLGEARRRLDRVLELLRAAGARAA